MDESLESIINMSLITSVFFLIISIAYEFNLTTIAASIIFFLSLFIPYKIIRRMSKGEIKLIFLPFIWSKIDLKDIWEKDYYKKLPCWLICSLLFSSLTLFFIPIMFIGRIFFEGWNNPFKEYDSDEENSENKLIADYLSLFLIIQIVMSLILSFINPVFGLVPTLVSFYLIWPLPGNLGFDLYYMNFKKWLETFFLVVVYFLIYLFFFFIYLGVKLIS